MSEATDKARDAVAERAAALSEDAAPETLKTIAEAVAQVHFGPQGWSGDTSYDYHATHHNENDRGAAGFGPPPAS